MDDKLRAFVIEALSNMCTFHGSQINTHVFEMIEYKSFATLLDETYQTEIALILSIFDHLTT